MAAAKSTQLGPEPEPEPEMSPVNQKLERGQVAELQIEADLGADSDDSMYYVLISTTVFETLENALAGADPAGALEAGAVLFALEEVTLYGNSLWMAADCHSCCTGSMTLTGWTWPRGTF